MSEAAFRLSDSAVESPVHRTRVVIIDDHPIVRRGLAELVASMPDLEMAGEAESYAQALEVLQTANTDVAIVDLSLDDSSGLDLLSEIRSRFPTVKSIVFSIHDAELYAPRALRAGAAGFVSKTQPCEDLLIAIRTLSEGEIYVAPDVAQRILRRMSSGGRARRWRRGAALGSRAPGVRARRARSDDRRDRARAASQPEDGGDAPPAH